MGAASSGRASAARPPSRKFRDSVICGDARSVLQQLPRESIHLAITSPPYNVGIAYSGYADNLTTEEYLAWLKGVWLELKRVLVVGGRF